MGCSEGDDNGEGTSEIGDEGDDRENDEGGGKRSDEGDNDGSSERSGYKHWIIHVSRT